MGGIRFALRTISFLAYSPAAGHFAAMVKPIALPAILLLGSTPQGIAFPLILPLRRWKLSRHDQPVATELFGPSPCR